MAKFKVRDKVTFKANLEVGGEYGKFTFKEDMYKFFGKCFTIKEVNMWCESYLSNEFDGELSEEMLISWSDLTTMDIVQIADRTGKTYITGDMRYNKRLGFHCENGTEWRANAFHDEYNGLSYFIHLKDWKEIKSTFTVEEAKLKLESFLCAEVEITD